MALPRLRLALFVAIALVAKAGANDGPAPDELALTDARHAFYNARYADAADMALESRSAVADNLAGYELRTSALLFQLKRLLGDDKGERRRVETCAVCPALLSAFQADIEAAQALARARLAADPTDETAQFFLGKIDLNYLWLNLGPLGRRTGWSEYREARRSLDQVLERNPGHLRARVAGAWVEYIVDTRIPWGTKWLFGGGDRRRAVAEMQAAAAADTTDFYALAEARFGLWEMLVREQDLEAAAEVARRLAVDFPENPEIARFLAAHGTAG